MNSDYLGWRLTGKWGMDHSTATTFYLQDQVARRWHQPHLALLGISEGELSPLAHSGSVLGTVTAEAARATGLSPETLVILGAFDHPCAARGTGTLDQGDLLLSCGTSWVDLFPCGDRLLGVKLSLLIDPFLAPPGPWALMAALTAVGVTIDRYILSSVLTEGTDPRRKYDVFNSAAASVPRGAGGLYVDLYRDPKTFLESGGLPVAPGMAGYTRPQVARALMEAAAFELRLKSEKMAEAGLAARRITMVGGPTESPLWPSIVSEVSGLPLRLINGQTAGAMGAAILAAVGCGTYADEREAFMAMGGEARVIEPDDAAVRTYHSLYQGFREVFRK